MKWKLEYVIEFCHWSTFGRRFYMLLELLLVNLFSVITKFVCLEYSFKLESAFVKILLTLPISHSLNKLPYIGWYRSFQSAQTMIFSFMEMTWILNLIIIWKHLKLTNFMSSVECSFIDCFVLEINLDTLSMFVLLLELSIIQFGIEEI